MRVKVYAVLCAAVLAAGSSTAHASCFVGYGLGRSPCYPAPIVYGPPAWSEHAFAPSSYDYYPPVERQQLVQPFEYSHSGWDVYSTYGWDAYAAAYGLYAYAAVDPGCFVRVPVLDGRGGWVWGMRAGCF